MGKTKEPAIQSLTDEYLKRISRYVPVEGLALRDEVALLQMCGRAPLTKASKTTNAGKSTLALMDSRGKQFSSEEFARFLGDYQDRNPLPLVFAVGPADGFSEAARAAASLDALRALLETFDGCALKHTATRLVFADGNPQARIMFVGEAPGREEDIEGLPFVGRSGKLLDRMISAIGLDRSSAYIANVIPWRPPGNRTPTPQETQICLPFIQRQIELVDPDILVTLGNPSTQTLLSTREGIMRTRGKWFDYDTGSRVIRALATFHPAYLLRSPSYKRMSWQDLRAIAKALEAS